MASILNTCRGWLRYHVGRLVSDVWVPETSRRARSHRRERRIDEALASADLDRTSDG